MRGQDTGWFVHDRLGVFIHWGLYALAARGEWLKSAERMSDVEYDRYFRRFNPDLYNPAAWVREFNNAGMKYLVVTSKHHDGFCLWDSALTDYKATRTPARRDLLKPLLGAARAEGLRTGVYYSLLDWHHPEFPVDGHHPMRDDQAYREKEKHRDMRKYAKYLHGQVKELLTGCGRLDLLWLDFSYDRMDWSWCKGKGKDDWQSEKLLALVRKLRPTILVNDRSGIPGDVRTPENYTPVDVWRDERGRPVVWESWQKLWGVWGGWGYNRDQMNLAWKPVEMLVETLIDVVSKGGNLILNVAPDARGQLDAPTIERLRGLGEWMRLHGRAVYGCGPSAFTPPPDCRYTQSGNRLYLHLFAWPYRFVHLPGMLGQVEYAQLLNDGSEVRMSVLDAAGAKDGMSPITPSGTLSLELPVKRPPVAVPVVELSLKAVAAGPESR